MPNWCSTQVTINSSKEEITSIKNVIEKIQELNLVKNSWGGTWLGLFLHHLGEYDEDSQQASCSCRGSVYISDADEDTIVLDVESAWSPHVGPIVKLCEKYAPNAEIMYMAIEPGCCIYISNDPTVVGQYLLDVWDSYELPESLSGEDYDFLDEIELRDTLIEALDGCEQNSTKQLIEEAHEKYGNKLSINQFQHADLEEVCV